MSLRTHVIFAIFKRNLASYFSSVIGYLFIVLFVVASAASAFTMNFFANNLANLDLLTKFYPWLLLFIAPAVAMTSWSEERKQGTDELLFTLPATDLEVLLGKYFALLSIYTVAILYSLLFCAFGVLAFLTTTSGNFADFDKTLILCNYFGYWISGASLLTCGMVASALTSSATVAFIGGAVLCIIPVAIDYVPGVGNWLHPFSVAEQLRDFSLGIASLSAVLYFVSIAVFMLYVNYVIISRRHWSGTSHGAPMWAHFLIRAAALVVLLISVNVAFVSASPRVDCTSERVYSVFPTTREVIQNIPKERPVFIQAFISPEVPGDYVTTRSNLIGLLRQYSRIGGRLLQVRIVDTRPYTDAADEAKRYGIFGQAAQNDVGGKKTVEQIYLGAVVSSGADDEVVIPFFDVGTPVEYELTRSVKTVSENKRRKVGILNTDARLFGGFDMATFGQSPEWRIVSELKKQYEVSEVSADGPITGDFDVLIAAMPSSLTEPQMKNLVEYVKSGKPALIFDDPLPITKPQMAPREPKPAPGGPFGHQPPPMPKADNGKATQLVNELGIEWNNGEVLWDRYNPHPEFASLVTPEYVFIDSKNGARYAFSRDDTISSGLQEILILVGGKIRPREAEDRKFIPLLRTSPNSGVHEWEDIVESRPSMFGMGGGIRMKDFPSYRLDPNGEFVVAAHITGTEKGKELNVVYVADLDMISDAMFQLRDRKYVNNLSLDNVTFVLNAVDVLAGDGSLVDIRKRRPKPRILTAVEQYTRDFTRELVEQRRAAEEEAKAEIEAAKKRFADARKKIDEQKLDPRTRQIMLDQVGQEENRRI
ncbi:MAG TPA: Gldg family protein, partial [Planctomycetaceae bacterium]|nr:Gldg family protein [Planctomycetaceae bacterium]